MNVDTVAVASRASIAQRLSLAREVLARANDRGKGGRRGQLPPEQGAAGVDALPVAPALASLFPGGGLPRGATVSLGTTAVGPGRRSMSLLFALMAPPSAAGAWCAAVGMPQLGLVAASEADVALSRLALIPAPGEELVGVVSALAEGLELIAVAGCARLRDTQRQALAARVRARGAVVLAVDGWPGSDLRIEVGSDPALPWGGWSGLGGDGHGRLRQRQALIRTSGHGLPPARANRQRSAGRPGGRGARGGSATKPEHSAGPGSESTGKLIDDEALVSLRREDLSPPRPPSPSRISAASHTLVADTCAPLRRCAAAPLRRIAAPSLSCAYPPCAAGVSPTGATGRSSSSRWPLFGQRPGGIR